MSVIYCKMSVIDDFVHHEKSAALQRDRFESCLSAGEGTTTEFKRCGNVPGNDVFETICSFANRQGGNIFLGVEDDGRVTGVDASQLLDIKRNITNRVNDPNSFNIPPAIELEEIEYDGASVLRIWVPVSSSVHQFKKSVYDRLSDADVKVRTDAQLSAMYIRKQEYYSERKVYPFLTRSDLRDDLIERARKMAMARRPGHPWSKMTDLELLKSANLYLKDYETGVEGFTFAAALLLGRDDVISSIAPTYKTDAYVQIDDVDRYDDRTIVKTNLIESFDLLIAFLQGHVPDRFHLEGTTSVSPRDIILRELVANSLMHREYTSPLPAKMVIDSTGIRTENASRPRFVGKLTPEEFNPVPKNPMIAEFFGNIGLADSLGSGTRNLFKYALAYGGATPTLSEGDAFVASVPLFVGFKEKEGRIGVDEAIDRMLVANGYVTVSEVAEMSGVTERTVRRHLAPMLESGVLTAAGTLKNRRFVPNPQNM